MCQIPSRNVLFLKTHYTGGDALTNILNRFADLRNLLVALPTDGLSSFYWPSKFHWRYLDLKRLEGNLPNVLCNHARYDAAVMTEFMPLSTHFVSMLRNPMDYFVTVFEELDVQTRMEMDHQNPIEAFALNTKKFLKDAIRKKRFFVSKVDIFSFLDTVLVQYYYILQRMKKNTLCDSFCNSHCLYCSPRVRKSVLHISSAHNKEKLPDKIIA